MILIRSRILYYIHLGLAKAAIYALALDAWLDGACYFDDAVEAAASHMKSCIRCD